MAIDSYRIFDTTSYSKIINFITALGVAVVPTSISYRIDDITEGLTTEILGDTPIIPDLTTYTLTVPSTLNAMVSLTHTLEKRLITIEYVYGVDSDRMVIYDSYEIQKRIGTVLLPSDYTYTAIAFGLILYGAGDPPDPTGYPDGTLFVQYIV
jgi:hypothetical protein